MPGGAAGGYCTRRCASDEECEVVDPQSGCLINGTGDPFCARRCLSKTPFAGEGKCLDRPDLACWSFVVGGLEAFDPTRRQAGGCWPMCSDDAECPGGYCDPLSAQCVDTPPAGAAVGAPCAVDAECAGGFCLEAGTTGTAKVCTSMCTFGTLGCGYELREGPREALCAVPWVRSPEGREGVGDIGACAELCDVTADCAHPAATCELDPQVPDRGGFCNFRTPSSTEADAGADAAR